MVGPTDTTSIEGNAMIVVNAASCNQCKELKVSLTVHDYRPCSCGKMAVDGGRDYLKRSGNREDYTEHSIIFDQTLNIFKLVGEGN